MVSSDLYSIKINKGHDSSKYKIVQKLGEHSKVRQEIIIFRKKKNLLPWILRTRGQISTGQ